MKSTLFLKLTLLILVPTSVAIRAEVIENGLFVREETKDGKPLVTIRNGFLELSFEPARGGRCSSFRFLDRNTQIIPESALGGMFIDHWAKYPWPSGLMWLPYQHEIVGDRKTRVGMRLWVVVPENGGGKGAADAAGSAKIPTSADLIGLVVRKTIWLNAANDVIEVEHEVENPTAEARGVACYVQHLLEMNGEPFQDTWYLPSTRGVMANVQPDSREGRAIGPDWVLDPTAGWMAVVDRQTRNGLLFAFDYNYLERIYTCGQTAEWFMEVVPVGPNDTFQTRYVIKPVVDFEDIVFGSRNVVADLRPDEIGDVVRVYHDLAGVSRELSDLEVHYTVVAWKSKEVIASDTLTVKQLGLGKARQEFSFAPRDLTDGVVIKMVVTGADFTDRYEYYYAGDQEEHERRYNFFATAGGALPGTRGDAYFQKAPRKAKDYDRPDFATVARPAADRFKCLVAFGLYTHILNLGDALTGWKYQGRYAPEITWANCPPNAVETFPATYEDLFAHHTIVLSDVNYKALGDRSFDMLCDYVEQGGNLLLTGGPYAFGNGEFEGARFLEVLPVTLSGPFDLKWAGKGKSWALTPAQKGSPVLEGVSFAEDPRVFWHHFVTPKRRAQVVLRAGDQPALVVGRHGKGQVAVLTLSPTGVGAAGETAWWDWEGWAPLVQNLFSFLNDSK